MLVENLKVGYHVSTREMGFVSRVAIPGIRECGYVGPIDVVGSRERKASRISTKAYLTYCRDLDLLESAKWFQTLNQIARVHDLSAGEIKRIADFLPRNTPHEIRVLIKNAAHLDSDLDLAIRATPTRSIQDFVDEPCNKGGSGLFIEVYPPGDNSWIPLLSVFEF